MTPDITQPDKDAQPAAAAEQTAVPTPGAAEQPAEGIATAFHGAIPTPEPMPWHEVEKLQRDIVARWRGHVEAEKAGRLAAEARVQELQAELQALKASQSQVDLVMPPEAFPPEVVEEAERHAQRRRGTLKLAQMRTGACVSLEQMADVLGLTPQQVLDLENGDFVAWPLRHLVSYVARCCGVDLSIRPDKPSKG